MIDLSKLPVFEIKGSELIQHLPDGSINRISFVAKRPKPHEVSLTSDAAGTCKRFVEWYEEFIANDHDQNR